MKLKTLAALAALCLPAFSGNAQPFSYMQRTDFFQELPALNTGPGGNFNAVMVCLRWKYVATVQAENTGAGPGTVACYVYATPLQMKLGNRLLYSGAIPDDMARVFGFQGFDGTVDYAGTSGGTFVMPQVMGNTMVMVTDPSMVADLLAGAQITLECTATSAAYGPGNFEAQSHSRIEVVGEVAPMVVRP